MSLILEGLKMFLLLVTIFFKVNFLLTHLNWKTNFTVKTPGFFPVIRPNISLRKYDKSSVSLSEAELLQFHCKKCVS